MPRRTAVRQTFYRCSHYNNLLQQAVCILRAGGSRKGQIKTCRSPRFKGSGLGKAENYARPDPYQCRRKKINAQPGKNLIITQNALPRGRFVCLSGKDFYMNAADFDGERDLVPKASPSGASRPFTQAGSNITFSLLNPPVAPPQSRK